MKKIKSIITALALICTLSACASGTQPEENSTLPDVQPVTVSQVMYKEEQAETPDDMNSMERLGYVKNSGVRLIYKDMNGVYKIADYDADMKVKSTTVLFSAENIRSTTFCISEDGTVSVFIVYVKSDEELGSEKYFENAEVSFEIRNFSAEGEQLDVIDMKEMRNYFEVPDDYVNDFTKINNNYVLRTNELQIFIDESGSVTTTQEERQGIYYCTDSDGKIIAAVNKGFSYMDNLAPPDDNNVTSYGKYLSLKHGISTGYDGFKAFFMLNDGVFGLAEDGSVIEVMDYEKSMMSGSDYYEVVYAGKGKFAAVGQNDDGTYLAVMNVRPDDYVMNREKVILGSIVSENSSTRESVLKYNKKSENYTVELKGYSSFDDLKRDILAGSPPDMYNFMDVSEMHRLVNLGVLADMYELSAQYGGFTKDDIMDNVISAYEYKDGLYTMTQTFGMTYTLGRSEYFPDGHMTYTEFFDIVNNAPEGVYLANAIDCRSKEYIFDLYCTYCPDRWIDMEKAECYFDTPEFINLLKFIDNAPVPPEIDWAELNQNTTDEERQVIYNEEFSRIGKGTALTTTASMMQLHDLLDIQEMYGLEPEDFIFIYPFNGGEAEIYGSYYYSIISEGNCPEGAWDYMNFLVSDDFLTSYLQTKSSFVTRKESFYKIIDRVQKISENPVTVDEHGITYAYGYSRAITDDEIQRLFDYVDTCTALSGSYGDVAEIIKEEYLAYTAGEITAERCGELIQNRVSIYLSENS